MRTQGVVGNTTETTWETAWVEVTILGSGDQVCARLEEELEWLQPGQSALLVTDLIERRDLESGCNPIAVTMAVPRYDIDSRTLETDVPPAPAAIVFADLRVVETVRFAGTSLRQLSIEGALSPESLELLRDQTGRQALANLRLEPVRADGLRLNWQASIDDVDDDGRFSTDEYHESVDVGEFVGVAVVPER